MVENILLNKSPKIEFQLQEDGFQLIDELTVQNAGFYPYSDLQSIELNKAWYPRLAKWLRRLTWILNGVPMFPDAETYKRSNVIIYLNNTKLGLWLTDTYMVDKARLLKTSLDKRM